MSICENQYQIIIKYKLLLSTINSIIVLFKSFGIKFCSKSKLTVESLMFE